MIIQADNEIPFVGQVQNEYVLFESTWLVNELYYHLIIYLI